MCENGEYEMRKTVWMLALAVSAAVCGSEKIVMVEEGATRGLVEALAAANHTLEAGDTLVKTGPGRLVGSDAYKELTVNLRVVEGVFEGRTAGAFFKGGDIAVRAGATLDVNNTGNSSASLLQWRKLYLAGAGSAAAAVTVNGRPLTGALLVRGTEGSFQVMVGVQFWLDGADATIAGAATGNIGYLTHGRINSKGDAHTLTLLGPGHTLGAGGACSAQYQHRFRLGGGFTNMTGRIVVDGASFTAHNVNYTVHPKAFPLVVKGGGTFGPEGTSFGACFSEVDFEWGSIIAGDGAQTATTLPPFTGFPAISTKTAVTVDNVWTVRAAELVAGRSLVAYRNPLTFGPNATVALAGGELLDSGTAYPLARADASIKGCPALVRNVGDAQGWRVVAGADGKTLQLVYEVPDLPGLVNVRDWGVLPGADRAEANVEAFAEGLAALDDGAEHVLFFPEGTYSFAAPVPVAGRSRLTLLGDNAASRLAVPATASGVLAVSDATAVTVTGFTLSGGAGAALAARGVEGLVVTNNVFADVQGVSADGVEGLFPVRAENCADALVRENRVAGGAVYAGPVLAAGTTTLADGTEPGADEVVLYAPFDRKDPFRTRPFAEALAERGLAAYPQGARLVKKGLGKLGGPTAAEEGNRLGAIDIQEGTFVGTAFGSLGPAGNTVTARDGTTVLLEPGYNGCVANTTTFSLGGTGASATDARAVLCMRKISWQYTLYSTFVLRSDAVFRYIDEGSAGIFSEGALDQNGHTLTLRGDRGVASEFRFRLSTLFRNGGPIVVEHATVSASYGQFAGEDGVRPPLLKIRGDARLRVNNQDFADVFALYDFESGGRWEAEGEGVTALTTANLKGAPALAASVALSVTNSYTARAADLAQGAKATAANALAFGAACVADVEGVETLPFTDAGYVLATSEVAISGRPRAGAALKEAGWTTALSADGKSLLLRPLGGFTLFLR